MRWNSIWIKELKTRARVVRIPILLMFYNAVMAIIAMFMLFASIDIFNRGNYIDYSGMTSLFAGLGALQCGMGFLITLVVASNSVASEKEGGTLDMILVTPASSGTLIRGKLLSAMTSSTLFVVSGMPVLALSSIYGGVGCRDMAYLAVVFLIIILFAGSTGLMCSCLMERSSLCIVTAMILEAALMIGPFIFLSGIGRLFGSSGGEGEAVFSYGLCVLGLTVSPLMLLAGFYDKIMGARMLFDLFVYSYGIGEDTAFFYFLQKNFIRCCILVQCLLSLVFLWIAKERLGGWQKKYKKSFRKRHGT